MLPKIYRLSLRDQLPKIKNEGRIYHGMSATIIVGKKLYSPNPEGVSRFGFIVSNRVSKSAVARNRIRRLLREAVYERLSRVNPGLSIVIIGKQKIVGKQLKEIGIELEKLFIVAGIIK